MNEIQLKKYVMSGKKVPKYNLTTKLQKPPANYGHLFSSQNGLLLNHNQDEKSIYKRGGRLNTDINK